MSLFSETSVGKIDRHIHVLAAFSGPDGVK
jgi:hypothetical protein